MVSAFHEPSAPTGRAAEPAYAGGVDAPGRSNDGTRSPDEPLDVRRWGLGRHLIGYEPAWAEQRRLHAERAADTGGDTVLLLEHEPVYTAGKRTLAHERPLDGTPVVDVDRGGKITFHGPGQLVGYPILRLPGHVYVVDHVRRIEEALIRACADLGLATGRVRGRSGVWLSADPATRRRERKVAAIGVRVSRGVTMHGFALNCEVDVASYDRIVPCGIADAEVTSLSIELGRRLSVVEAADAVEPHLHELFSWRPYDRLDGAGQRPAPGQWPRVWNAVPVARTAAP